MIKTAVGIVWLSLLLAGSAAAQRPIVIELFTSEGCSSCPPADALLAELAAQPDVLALSFHVDYWDRLGWKDPFSSAAATRRQQRYVQALGLETVYTPQIIVDGHWQAVGSDRGAVDQAFAAARHMPGAVPVTLIVGEGRARVTLGADAVHSAATVVLIGFDRLRVDAVERGENAGRTLSHVDVVRGFAEIGPYDGKARTIEAALPWHAERAAVLVQAADGHVLGAAVADLSPF